MIAPLKRAVMEGAGTAGGVIVALAMTTQEVALGIAIVTAAVGVVIWLVRLEGRVNTLIRVDEERHKFNTRTLDEMSQRLGRIADRMGVE